MVFGDVVGKIVATFLPVDAKLALVGAILEPVEAHVDGFRSALLDGAMDDSSCCGIVGLDRGRRLGVT